MIKLIYILIFLILIFVAYLGLKAVSYGIEAKQKNKSSKNYFLYDSRQEKSK